MLLVPKDLQVRAVGMLVILTGLSLFIARLGGATAAGLEIAGGVLCCVGLMLVVVGWQRVRAEKARVASWLGKVSRTPAV